MDSSNDSSSSGGPGARPRSSPSSSSSGPMTIRAISEGARQYDAVAREQIARECRDYEVPLYARISFLSREGVLQRLHYGLAAFSGLIRRPLTDTEVKAYTEHMIAAEHSRALYGLPVIAFAGYKTYTGLATYKLPFWRIPERHVATAGPVLRAMFHSLRFGVWWFVARLFAVPAVTGFVGSKSLNAMRADPRLSDVIKERQSSMMGGARQNAPGYPSQGESRPSNTGSYQNSDYESSTPQQQQPDTPSWGNDSDASYGGAPAQERSSAWDAPTGIDDDASPTAPQYRNQQPAQPATTSWAQIRREKMAASGQAQQGTQASPRRWAPTEAQGSWGENAGRSPEYRGPVDNFSFPSQMEDKSSAKSQAQREFDDMLERERRNAEQEPRGGWSRK